MFHKIFQVPVLLHSLVLILLFLSDDVTSTVEPLPMGGPGSGSGSLGGGGGLNADPATEMGVPTVSASTVNINGGTGSAENDIVWSPRQVITKLGIVQGFIVQPPNGYPGVEVFLNLPYASSPEGNLRFMPPVSPDPWKGTRRSTHPSPVCPQVLPYIKNETEALKVMTRGKLMQLKRLLPMLRNQSEDCLYLNIYMPSAVAEGKIEGKLPVLVFIHGESNYGYGGGHPYDPTMFVSVSNTVVVTLNYRLGILGFLNADADGHFKLPFNFALLDQIAALQWVQENIEMFGGDKSRVTLMGHGRGSVMANFLMISNAVPTGLLFHRVILSSGSALSPLAADLSKGPELARKFARKVKCPTEPSSTMLQCLRELPLKYFLESELWNLFGPTGDGIVVKHTLPSESVIMNRISHYPLIFGVVRAELLPSLNNHDATYGLESERRRELLRQFIRKHYSFHRNEILAGAIHEYTDWEKPAQHPLNVRDETIDALADAQVVAPLTKIGDLHAASSRTKAYFYVFDYQSKNSEYQQRLGCVHGEDLLYIFGIPLWYWSNEEFGPISSNGAVVGATSSHVDDSDVVDQNGIHTTKGDIISGSGKSSGDQHQLQQRKEKWRKRNERSGGLGFFAGNFTWYEVQLSATVMQLWTNFIWTSNPNGDAKSQSKVAYGMMGTSSASSTSVGNGAATYPQPSKGRSSSGKSRKVKDELAGAKDDIKEDGKVEEDDEQRATAGVAHNNNNNRLRLSRDNMMTLTGTQIELEHQQQLQQLHHHHYHQPKPIYVEWPEYDSLDKKYLIFDLRPKVRNHYRAHKLSFWRFLVPDYQKNYEGTSAVSLHHEISVYGMVPGQNLSKISVIQPTIFASGLHDTAMGLNGVVGGGGGDKKTRYNSSRNGNTIDSGRKRSGSKNNQNKAGGSNNEMGASVPTGDSEERQKQRDSADFHVPPTSTGSIDPLESPFGFHTYSTALSVTVAIGCSLLILNILIFATFYYEREKRRHEHRRQKQQMDRDELKDEQQQQHSNRHQSESCCSRGTFFRQQSSSSLHDKFPIPLTTSSISCGASGSASASLKRRRDNNSSYNTMTGGGSIVSSSLGAHHHAHTSALDGGTTTTVFCEHYVDEEVNMNVFNDLCPSPYLSQMGRKNGADDNFDQERRVLSSRHGGEDDEMEATSSSQHQARCMNDMNYRNCASASGTLRKHFSCNSSSANMPTVSERGFVPISPAPPCSSNTPTFSGSLRTPSGSLRQKRKAFAIATSSSSSTGGPHCVPTAGGLNEFSMSDVMVEPVTNVPNFSPQSSTTHTSTAPNELFEIENIPTAEELIQADLCNATATTNSSNSTNSNNDRGSVATVVIVPDFVSHHESPTNTTTSAGHFFHNE